jgi:hypothetical protein
MSNISSNSDVVFPKLNSSKEGGVSYYVDKVIALGDYNLSFDKTGGLVKIKSNSLDVRVNVTQNANYDEVKYVKGEGYVKVINSVSTTIYRTLDGLLKITSSEPFNFKIISSQKKLKRLYLKGVDGFEKLELGDNISIGNIKAGFFEDDLSIFSFLLTSYNKPDSVKTKRESYLEFSNEQEIVIFHGLASDFTNITGFKMAEFKPRSVISLVADQIILFLKNIFNSQIMAIYCILILVFFVNYPLEKYISKQNILLNSVKEKIQKIRQSVTNKNEQTKLIRNTYKVAGVNSLVTPMFFILKITLLIVTVHGILNSQIIESQQLLFITDIKSPLEGWKLSWILIMFLIIETRLQKHDFTEKKFLIPAVFTGLYVACSFYWISPIAVLIFIFFFLGRLISTYKSITNFKKELTYVSN